MAEEGTQQSYSLAGSFRSRVEMEERVRKTVEEIYGDVLSQCKRRTKLKHSESLEKLLPPAKSAYELEIRKLVRQKAEQYMLEGEQMWTEQVKELREYYLRLLSGEKFVDDGIVFDSKGVINGDATVSRLGELKVERLK